MKKLIVKKPLTLDAAVVNPTPKRTKELNIRFDFKGKRAWNRFPESSFPFA